MPLYDFNCEACGTVTETRQGFETASIPCRCGAIAQRVGVYREQFIQAETGPVGGKKNEIPPSDIRLGREVSEFQEASKEVAYHYDKAETEGVTVKRPNLFKRGMREARKKNPKIATSV